VLHFRLGLAAFSEAERRLGLASDKLPKFRKPPVAEVAISVFFNGLPGLKTAHIGKFWNLIEKDYPKTQDLLPIVEGPASIQQLVSPDSPLPLRRVFLISADDTFVTQIQQNFFAHNWRKIKETDEYPSFDRPSELFLSRWEIFQDFLRGINAGEMIPTRYEITYVNQFVEPKGAFPLALERYSPVISLRHAQDEPLVSAPKALTADLEYDLPAKLGTLRVAFKQGERPADKMEVMQVDLTARVFQTPDGPDLRDWLEKAHECLALSFVSLTTKEAHEKWGRTQ
jgi:uncharacterized protein (TIGR04255 family)